MHARWLHHQVRFDQDRFPRTGKIAWVFVYTRFCAYFPSMFSDTVGGVDFSATLSYRPRSIQCWIFRWLESSLRNACMQMEKCCRRSETNRREKACKNEENVVNNTTRRSVKISMTNAYCWKEETGDVA